MKEIITALKKAQAEFPRIPRGRTARVPTKSGGSYSYSYADLGDVVEACTPVLHKFDLVLFQSGAVIEGKQALRTTLGHISGETITSDFILMATDDYQDAGAGITYFRRYAQCAILGIVTEEDSDGQQKPNTPPPTAPKVNPSQSEPGSYVIQCAPYKGKRLDQVGQHDLNAWCQRWRGKDVSGALQEALAETNKYLDFVERKTK